MTAADWLILAENVLSVLLTIVVACVAIASLMAAYQFLLLPFQAWFNHYKRASPYLPRVAVIVPAWNEGAVIGSSIDRLMALEYPEGHLRIYVVDDASTDDTPDVVRAKEKEYPGSVYHLRRDKGGEGKAHTLNHGIAHVLADDWMEALLIMDADVIYLPDSLRKMTRHLADPEVGAVTAYIREGTRHKNFMNRFIAFEYVLAQVGSRRAQNLLGAMACLAGGAQLHSRANLEDIGGRIDTSSLAEDTVTTFKTQLAGRRVVFEPHAVVLAEEPHGVNALWKQRLRWARGNVQLTSRYRTLWFRRSSKHKLGSISFGLIWFSTFLLPGLMIVASVGLISLYLMDSQVAAEVFRSTWIVIGCAYVYVMALAVQLDPQTGRICWREVILFPGAISLVVMATALFPELFTEVLPALAGRQLTDAEVTIWNLSVFSWISLCMVAGWLARKIDMVPALRWLSPFYVYLVGYGPILCAITFDSYIKEARGAAMVWDKTEKTGRVLG